jgi:hypothetical protein
MFEVGHCHSVADCIIANLQEPVGEVEAGGDTVLIARANEG